MVPCYPKTLSVGVHNTVTAVSESEAAKLSMGDTRSDIGSESEKMKFANSVNNLAVKFIRVDIDKNLDCEMLVMERLYPMDFRAYEIEKRELWFDLFEDDLIELHKAGFAHRDIKRPGDIPGEPYDNVLLTSNGLRLTDTGVSALKLQVGISCLTNSLMKSSKKFPNSNNIFGQGNVEREFISFQSENLKSVTCNL